MARDYGRVATTFWNSQDVRPLSDQGKLLANYLLSGPHSNSIGAYLLPDAYVADDLQWTAEKVSKAFTELFRNGFATRFKDGRHICICKFLTWNPIENPNVGKAALKQLEQLPDDPALEHVFNGLSLYEKQFPNGLETLRERFTKPFRNIEPKPNRTEPEPKPIDTPAVAGDPLQAALDSYNLGARNFGWPQAQRLTPRRRSALRARLIECGGLSGWEMAMTRAGKSDFLAGRTPRTQDHEKWMPDLDFFLQQQSFTKLMEGSYDNHSTAERGGAVLGAVEIAGRYLGASGNGIGDPDRAGEAGDHLPEQFVEGRKRLAAS